MLKISSDSTISDNLLNDSAFCTVMASEHQRLALCNLLYWIMSEMAIKDF